MKLVPCTNIRNSSPSQAIAAISDIHKDFPIHLELASMTDRDYMNRIMQEVRVKSELLKIRNSQFVYVSNENVLPCLLLAGYAHCHVNRAE